MVRSIFESELQDLRERILALGSEVGDNIVESVQVLRNRDLIAAQQLIAGDLIVNQKRIEILKDGLTLIATQQPMAGDMRMIASILEINGELERINDYAKGIGRITLMIGPEPIPSALDNLPIMAEKTRDMLYRALDAAANRDVEMALAIPREDDEVDALFNEIFRELVTYVANDPSTIEQSNHLEWAAHNIERAADRVTNICEWIVYMATGEYQELDTELEAPPPQG
jgi:phosphate transport system protein